MSCLRNSGHGSKINIESIPQNYAQLWVRGPQKIQLMYYGMVYTILQHNGFFLRGKNASPINITCSKYCQLFSQNRKSLSNNIYTFNFYDIEKEKGSKVWIKTYDLGKLTPIFYEIEKEILEQK